MAEAEGKTKQKRSGVACFPCRRGRRKCMQEHEGVLPCVSCKTHNRVDQCVLATAGTSRQDREPRGMRFTNKRGRDDEEGYHPTGSSSHDLFVHAGPSGSRQNYNHTPDSAYSSSSFSLPAPLGSANMSGQMRMNGSMDDPNGLPPLEIVMEGCEAFFNGYFQLCFLNRPSFMHQLVTDTHSINPFLLLGILAVSARFVPSLVDRYGGRQEAVDAMSTRAHSMLVDQMLSPSLEKVQAIYLLSLADWGKGLGHRSRLLFGTALQMAEMIKLSVDDPAAGPIETEVRRRTWWFLNLTSNSLNVSSNTPTILDPLTVSIPLPSHEDDFAFGALSSPPTYFPGSAYASSTPDPKGISLLGVLLTIFVIWGSTSRALCGLGTDPELLRLPPWHPDGLLESHVRKLNSWLTLLSNKQKWSVTNLLAYKSANLDLSLFSIFANFHLNHIALRRQYLPVMIKALHPLSHLSDAEVDGQMPPNGLAFWEQMANALVTHALDTIELQALVKKVRTVGMGSSPYMSFALYLSGTIANYVRCCPWLCPTKVPQAVEALATALEILGELADVWPMSQRWHETLLYQSQMSPFDSTAGERATLQASKDLNLDRSVGIFRQFADNGAASKLGAVGEPDSFAAANTLAQLGGGGGATPAEMETAMTPGFAFLDPALGGSGEGGEQDGLGMDPFQMDLNVFMQGSFDYSDLQSPRA